MNDYLRAVREKQEVEIGILGQLSSLFAKRNGRLTLRKREPRANSSEGADRPPRLSFARAASHLPGPGSHQVGVGALERHRPGVTAQDADHPRRQLLHFGQHRQHLRSHPRSPPA